MAAVVRPEGAGQGAATKASIALAARKLFMGHGYAATSVRAIAAAVGVDPALVIRYFGSKEQLFLETVRMPSFVERAMPGPIGSLGERIVAAAFDGDVEGRLSVFNAMMRASDADSVREQMREAGERTFIQPLVGRLEGPDAELRARLIAAQITGLLSTLALGGDPMFGGADRGELIRTYGRAVQVLIDPPR